MINNETNPNVGRRADRRNYSYFRQPLATSGAGYMRRGAACRACASLYLFAQIKPLDSHKVLLIKNESHNHTLNSNSPLDFFPAYY